MRIVCVGGGPAGLYFAISVKRRDPRHEVTVLERNPAGVTYGWGVTFSDGLLDSLYRNDPVTAAEIDDRGALGTWDDQEVHIRSAPPVHLGGYGYAIGRRRLLDILARRAVGLGVDLRFRHEVGSLDELAGADLVVACDGANSRTRQATDGFGTEVELGRNKYIWLGTHRVFEAFRYAFEHTDAGWIWYYSYPFSPDTTTFIVECPPQTWRGLGFDDLGPQESIAALEDVFKSHLDGDPLMNPMPGLRKAPWLNFPRVTNTSWYRGNVALMGDAAHTTHFSIGSGTTLAMQDAIGLADALARYRELPAALAAYQADRQEALRDPQRAAVNSARWFEDLPGKIEQEPIRFGYELWRRRGGHPSWRYPVHLATQLTPLRRVRSALSAARRRVLARRRIAAAAPPSVPASTAPA